MRHILLLSTSSSFTWILDTLPNRSDQLSVEHRQPLIPSCSARFGSLQIYVLFFHLTLWWHLSGSVFNSLCDWSSLSQDGGSGLQFRFNRGGVNRCSASIISQVRTWKSVDVNVGHWLAFWHYNAIPHFTHLFVPWWSLFFAAFTPQYIVFWLLSPKLHMVFVIVWLCHCSLHMFYTSNALVFNRCTPLPGGEDQLVLTLKKVQTPHKNNGSNFGSNCVWMSTNCISCQLKYDIYPANYQTKQQTAPLNETLNVLFCLVCAET